MSVYMTQFSYTAEAWAALTKNPQDRSKPVAALAEKCGGKLIGLYYCMGEYDGVVLTELPSDTAAAAVAVAAVAPGHISKIRTTRLMSVEETLEALRLAGGATLSAPTGD